MTNEEKIKKTMEDISDITKKFDDGELDLNDALTYLLERRYIASHINDSLAKQLMSAIDVVMIHILADEVNDLDPKRYITVISHNISTWKEV